MNKHDSIKGNLSHSSTPPSEVVENPWRKLREYTDARIGLGRSGVSLPTHEMLAFQLAHAQAKDAVHMPLNVSSLQQKLNSVIRVNQISQYVLHSQAIDRVSYLQRPDLGRRLDESSQQQLNALSHSLQVNFDLAIVIVDGLSSKAVQQNAAPFIETLLNHFANDADLKELQLAPITIVEQGRVAIGDEIGELLNAKLVVVLIGERPGLSSPDSLGLYLTWEPNVGRNDAQRNCISNIRPAGLSFEDASQKALYLIKESRRLKLTGVNLKDRSNEKSISNQMDETNFLIE
ncbi:ethanolamine ammonia-lyase subunit EutC [Thiomicrorhabdus sp.]|uniref:ethanolamine ammonia-lyase subunit EutC n=1 Tax=Thiomicrorhabdus sp. TaxID=2039724 RepID=UPI002AA93D24|nr:ethanolamine ammonia-lyase subunit EutC [Thiomicrorhabdus sp.]